jgi:FtsZ-binding cell division protein ZapB
MEQALPNTDKAKSQHEYLQEQLRLLKQKELRYEESSTAIDAFQEPSFKTDLIHEAFEDEILQIEMNLKNALDKIEKGQVQAAQKELRAVNTELKKAHQIWGKFVKNLLSYSQ